MSLIPLNSRVGSSKAHKMHGRSKGLLSRIGLLNKYLYKRENCTAYIVFNYILYLTIYIYILYIYLYIYICIYKYAYMSMYIFQNRVVSLPF